MPYWELVTRSFRIAWNHKYLWLIALFSGEAGGTSFNYSQSTSTRTGAGQQPDIAAVQQQVAAWISDHIGLIVALGIVWLVLVIAFFILAAVCEGATVRASAEHDADRPFGLRWAWRSGVSTMWAIVRFRLLLFLLYLPLIVLIAAFVVAIIASIANHSGGAVVGLVLAGLLLLLITIPYLVYVTFLDRFGSRAIVLEQVGAKAGIVRAHRLLRKRLGRALLVWLLSIAVGIVVAIALACFLAIVFIPLVLVGVAIAAAGSSHSALLVGLIILGLLVLIPVSLILQGFVAAQGSTYWTLAFRRLDLEYAPAPAYQIPPPQAPPPPPPLPQPE
jgi:hypothetical protein